MKRLFGFVVLALLLSCHASTFHFDDISEYDKAIPVGWTVDNTYANRDKPFLDTIQPASVADEKAMCIVFTRAYAGATMFLTTTDALTDEVTCDNLVFSVTVYVEPKGANTSASDCIQPVISIDDGDFVEIGDLIPFKSPLIQSPQWMTYSFPTNIQEASQKGIRIGLKSIAGGNSSARGYVKSVSADFKVCALIKSVDLVSGDRVCDPSSALSPNMEDLKVRAKIDVYPDDHEKLKILEDGVSAEIATRSTSLSMKLEDGNDGYWYSAPLPNMDAGVEGEVLVSVPYTSPSHIATLDPTNASGIATGVSAKKNFTVGKRGSIWMNEITANAIEFCGTTNRVYVGGWSLSISNHSQGVSRVITLPFQDFNVEFEKTLDKTKGVVGVASVTDIDFGAVVYPVTVRLLNPSGITEDEVVFPECPNVSWSRVNYARWNEELEWSYDWTGTADGRVFDWVNTVEASIGDINPGQGFRTPEKKVIRISALVGTNGFPNAEIAVSVKDFGNESKSSGETVKNEITDTNGSALCELWGWPVNLENLDAYIHAKAFGWQSSQMDIVIPRTDETNEFSVTMAPSTAVDGFQTELSANWVNEGRMYDTSGKLVTWMIKDNRTLGKYLCLNTSRAYGSGGTQYLRCANHLSPEGKPWLNLALETKNMGSNYAAGRKDLLTFLFCTNSTFNGEVVTSSQIIDKNPKFADGVWYQWANQIRLPEGFANAPELWVKLKGVSEGATSSELAVKNLRIAFQDMVTGTRLTRSGTEANPGFEVEVQPWCPDGQCVSNVSVQLVMDVNGTVFTNTAISVSSGVVTNTLSEAMVFAVEPEIVSAGLKMALGQSQLRVGDTVQYWAQVNYYADSRDPDNATEWEMRYFPDNTEIESEDRWKVEGAYSVDMASVTNSYAFVVSGDPISLNGDFVYNDTDVTTVSFGFRAYDTAGVSNVTVRISTGGEEKQELSFATNAIDVVRFDNEVTLEDLAANTDYTVTITAVDVNGVPLKPATFTFTTLPEVTGATIAGVSTNEVKLTVSGAAAGYVVPSGWTPQGANTWTRNDGTPNKMFEATVYGTNRLGQASAVVSATPGHTHAAVATRAPVVEKKDATTVTVRADESYAASDDGNPEGTEYAIRVTTSAGATNDVAVWKTLADWREHPETLAAPDLDLEAVNTFSFITRNFDGFVTTNEAPVTTSCSFPLTADFVDGKVEQKVDGTVSFSLAFFDPAGRDGAKAEVAYQLGDGGTWQSVCEPFAVVFEELAATRALVWDARTAVGKESGEYPYSLRARVVSGDRASEWAEVSGTLDFAPPADLTVNGTPAPGTVTAERGYSFTLSARDRHAVSYSWKLDGVAGTGGTVSGTAAQDGTHTLVVTATDALGNTSAAVTYTWTLDTTAPTQPVLSGTPADGAFANVKEVSLTAASEDATALTYHWTFNGKEMEGEGATLTATAQEGVNTVGVSATDAAGNKSPTTTWSWTVDTTPPTKPVLSGTPGALTNVEAVNLTAASEDVTALTYHWTFNGVDATGPSLAGTAREGANTVGVYATDAAGNVSQTTTYSWTLDTIPPQNLSVNGTPAKDAKTKENTVNLTASATDAHALTYHWTFNGVDSTGPSLVGTAREGKNTARVFAEDAAGNRCDAVTYAWTVDTEKPTNLALDGTPANGAVTKEPAFGFSAKAEDATALTYHWTLKTAAGERTATGETFDGAVEEDGAYTVSVFAEDETGNASETASRSWTVDRVAPRVELASATAESFNAEKVPLVVAVTFSEPVTDFTAAVVTVENGTVTDVEKVGKNEAEDAKETYRVTITPEKDGEVAVQIMAGVVADAAGNGNEASEVLARTYDTTRPTGTLTSEMTDVFNAAKLVVTATFSEAVTGFTADAVTVENGTVDAVEAVDGDESAYTVTVTPASEGVVIVQIAEDAVADAAGNRNVASAVLTRTYDVTPPTRPELSGTPMANTTTNAKEVNLTAVSTDAAALTYHWTFNGKEMDGEGTTFTATAQEGANTVGVYAEDAAGNRSETTTVTWTLDTTPPTVELASETPEPFNAEKDPFVVTVTFSEAVADFAAAAVAVENGVVDGVAEIDGVENAYTVTITPTAEGEVSVRIAAAAVADAAGNGNTASAKVTRTHDRTPPTVELSCTTPARFNGNQRLTVTATFSESVTGFAVSSVSVENGTVNGVTEVAGLENTYTLTVTPKEDGEVAVWIAADAVADLAGNGNVASAKLTRTYDTAAPTVTLTDVGEVKELYNAHDVFTVQVVFSEPVTDFTADAVTVENGTVTKFEVKEGTEDAYLVTITPTADGVVSVQIAAGAVTDRAGNGNAASDVRARTYDITPPTVTRFVVPDSILDEKNSSLDVTVTFSEPVTNFTAESVTVVNCDARAVREAGENTYLFTVVPIKNGTYSIQIAEGAVADAAGNGNVASEVVTRIYDTDAPTKPVISGTPANGSTVRTRAFSLIADATDDASGVKVFRWYINGTRVQVIGKNTLTSEGRESLIHEGVNTVTVEVRDATPSHWSEMSETYTWTYEPGTTTGDVAFGGDVRVKVDAETGKTNSVCFTAVAFKPGAASTFTLAGFEASTQEITDLRMWLVVCETLGGTPWRVQVNEAARFDSTTGELTVTLPPEATLKKPDGEPYSSLFILGIDNKDAAE